MNVIKQHAKWYWFEIYEEIQCYTQTATFIHG